MSPKGDKRNGDEQLNAVRCVGRFVVGCALAVILIAALVAFAAFGVKVVDWCQDGIEETTRAVNRAW